jgi:cell division protein FtsI/penicillin-binding protein 2
MLKSRLMVAAGVLVLWALGIEVRLVVLQVLQHDQLVARAERQQMSTVLAPAKRGEIFDRNGRRRAVRGARRLHAEVAR